MTNTQNTPEHIAIIMDGNGRWAKNKLMPTSFGHKQGAETAREIINVAQKTNIKFLTLYAFSSENWKRSKSEVDNLMQLLHLYINNEKKHLNNSNIRIIVIGNLEPVPSKLAQGIKEAEEKTKHNTGMTLIIALSYGGREEIICAAKRIAELCLSQKLSPKEISEKTFTSFLYTSNIPDPDLIIRTGGELRISNFLLWQSAYAEFYFTKAHWPEFNEKEFKKALTEFQTRKRNYGK
ncbi:MAG: isoprenyl transferase [Alphaproteobacteria bacterium]|nr:isoprenyl transferase [Alphaproteobacteria bacterium]